MKTELQIAADKLVREIFGVKPGETVVLTADYDSNENVLRAVSDSVREADAQVMVITVPTPPFRGKGRRSGSAYRSSDRCPVRLRRVD